MSGQETIIGIVSPEYIPGNCYSIFLDMSLTSLSIVTAENTGYRSLPPLTSSCVWDMPNCLVEIA